MINKSALLTMTVQRKTEPVLKAIGAGVIIVVFGLAVSTAPLEWLIALMLVLPVAGLALLSAIMIDRRVRGRQ